MERRPQNPEFKIKVFRIIPEFRILRLTFQRKSASKCLIREIIIAFIFVLDTWKNDEDPSKSESIRVLTTLLLL